MIMQNDTETVNQLKKYNSKILVSISGIIFSFIIILVALSELEPFSKGEVESIKVHRLIALVYDSLGLNGVYTLALLIFVISIISTIKALNKRKEYKDIVGHDIYREAQVSEMQQLPGFISGINKDGTRKSGKVFYILLGICALLALTLILFLSFFQ